MEGSGLTPFAWVFMLFSMGSVTVLAIYCFYRVLFGGAGTELSDPTGERDA